MKQRSLQVVCWKVELNDRVICVLRPVATLFKSLEYIRLRKIRHANIAETFCFAYVSLLTENYNHNTICYFTSSLDRQSHWEDKLN